MRQTSHRTSSWITAPGPVSDGLRIGLLGGSFDPAHCGHIYISQVACRALKLDYVWWLVSPGNPLKPDPGPLAVRVARARRVARGPRIIVTDIESRLHTRFTVETVTRLKRRFPQPTFIWLMGSDNLEQFSRWRRWRQIADTVPIAVVRRPGSALASLHAPLARRFGVARCLGSAPSLVMLDGARSSESSSEIRAEALGATAEAMLNLTP